MITKRNGESLMRLKIETSLTLILFYIITISKLLNSQRLLILLTITMLTPQIQFRILFSRRILHHLNKNIKQDTSQKHSFFFNSFTSLEIHEIIWSLRSSDSCSRDNILSNILKNILHFKSLTSSPIYLI